ncbi:XdhC family protein [Ferrovum sp. PN-J185]|uniref:XdhC family protein n=1 Tax=Ferrovum sp. PN-J185 TaxID=1356306 RepID=UPI0007968240|nr:XdhC family protein [Ferrovum sp. PN-J185]KXW55714.1 putative xanthine dehydrogenase subunit A [Ferrovum sp. PN-J185]
MDSADLLVLETLNSWLQDKRRCYLVTLVGTVGSAPRSAGSLLGLTDKGDIVGSVSGGCVEDQLVSYIRENPLQYPQYLSYGIDQHQALRYLLPCGGTIELVIEPLTEHSQLSALCALINSKTKVLRQLSVTTGEVKLTPITEFVPKVNWHDQQLEVVFGPRYRLLIIGANQIGIYLTQMAQALDYHVLVCDPREEIRRNWPINNTEVSALMPDDFIREQQPDLHTAIVALTHDLKQDDLALLEALTSSAFFVGAVGSKKTQQARRTRLESFDLSATQLAKLKGPVGLSIGSKTPPEIALAILAQITAIKNGITL